MNIGFKGLDNLINIEQPQLILLTGTPFVDMLSGDIANNVCINQKCEVLEIVKHKKEYLIKRLLVNNAMVDYKKWTEKDQYTKEELQQIGQSTVNLIETTRRLPTIIEQDLNLYNLKKVAKLVSDFANEYADKEKVSTLVVLDIFPLSAIIKSQDEKINTKKSIAFIRRLKKISSKLRCTIILIDNIDNINKINKYVDTFIMINKDETKKLENTYIFDVNVYNSKEKIGTCKLKYDFKSRKFLDYKE